MVAIRTPLRCYRCGTRVAGSRCPHCGDSMDFHDMDMRVRDYLRILSLMFAAVFRSLPHPGSCRPPVAGRSWSFAGASGRARACREVPTLHGSNTP